MKSCRVDGKHEGSIAILYSMKPLHWSFISSTQTTVFVDTADLESHQFWSSVYMLNTRSEDDGASN